MAVRGVLKTGGASEGIRPGHHALDEKILLLLDDKDS
jgi:hypothetical protein